MAEHRITARLDYQTQQAERNLDRLQRVAEKTERQLRRLSDATAGKTLGISRDQAISRETRELEKQTRAYERLGSTVDRVNRTQGSMAGRAGFLGGTQGMLGTSARLFGSLATAYGGYRLARNAVQTIVEEQTLRNYIRTVGGTDETGRSVAQLGGTIGKSRTDLLRGAYQALSSGVSEQDVRGLVEIAGKASVAGGPNASVEGAVDIFTSIAQAYKKNGQADFSQGNINKISDMLFKSVELGKVEFTDLQQNLGDVLSAGAVTGVPVEQLLAALTTASLSGVKAPEATTALKQMLLSIAAPTPEAAKEAKRLGIDMSAESIKKIGLPGVLKQIAAASKNNIEELDKLFPNIRALTGFLTQFGENAGKFDEVLKQISGSAGSTDKAFKVMSEGVANQWQVLKNNAAELAVTFADSTGILDKAGQAMKGMSYWFNDPTEAAAAEARKAGPFFEAGSKKGQIYVNEAIRSGQVTQEELDMYQKYEGMTEEQKKEVNRKATYAPSLFGGPNEEGKMMRAANKFKEDPFLMGIYTQSLGNKKKLEKDTVGYITGEKPFTAETFSRAQQAKERGVFDPLTLVTGIKKGLESLKKVDAKQVDMMSQNVILNGSINLGSIVGNLLSGDRGTGGNKKTGVAGVMQSLGF